MLNIKKNDFELLPTKLSIAKLYAEHLSRISANEHHTTHEQIFEEIAQAHIRIFGADLPFSSFDSFRKYFKKYRKEIWKKP